jgi:sterol desaturase/sphingolipid hydroxylase (fatty acid hydroxylase superfamily)
MRYCETFRRLETWNQEMSFDAVLQHWSGLIATFVACAAVCSAIEFLSAAERRSVFSRLRGAFFWSICLVGIALGVVASQEALRAIGIHPLISLDLSEGGWLFRPLLLVPLALLPALILDVAYYWCHRLQHAIPFLWRFHAVHHAIEELNGTNCYHHWSEGLVRPVLILLPLALLIQLKVPEVAVISLLTNAFWGYFIHVKTNISFGPLDRLFVSPAFHRVHHSRDARHYDKNFAGVFSALDVAFGTAHFPTKDERIKTGLNEKHEASTLGEYLIALRDRHHGIE